MNLDLEDFIPILCKRPGMFVGREDFYCVAAYINGYVEGFRQSEKRDDSVSTEPVLMRNFSVWLYTQCFPLNGFGRNYVWPYFLSKLFPDDTDALTLLPILFHEFKTNEREAGGQTELMRRIENEGISFEEYMVLGEEDELLNTALSEANQQQELAQAQDAMRVVMDAAMRGEAHPLASHIAKIRAAQAENKAQAAAALRALQSLS